jgi:alkylation response protein AidB-like acyl-CoA dehydrogenase
MDFELSPEQEMLKRSVEDFLRDHGGFAQRREALESEAGFSAPTWARFAELGWLALPFSESSGGLGGSAVDTNVLLECLGARIVPCPFVATILLGGKLIELAGSSEQKAAQLPAVIGGERLLAFAATEPGSGFDHAHVETRAVRSGDGFVLDGRKSVVLHAASADAIIVSARTGGGHRERSGISLFVVERGAAGLSRHDYRTLDGQRASDLRLEHVEVSSAALLGEVGEAFPIIDEVIDRAICALCAEAVGAMRAAIEMTREYVATRRQFGAPIGSNQVIRHRLVDMHVAAEESKSMTDMAAMRIDARPAERHAACAATKAKVGRAARFVGEQAIQLHGGIGMTDEYPVGHYYKRLATIDMSFGNAEFHLGRFAELSAR